MHQAASNFFALGQNSRDVPPSGQEQIGKIVGIISSHLQNVSKSMPQDETLQIGESLTLTTLNLLKVRYA